MFNEMIKFIKVSIHQLIFILGIQLVAVINLELLEMIFTLKKRDIYFN